MPNGLKPRTSPKKGENNLTTLTVTPRRDPPSGEHARRRQSRGRVRRASHSAALRSPRAGQLPALRQTRILRRLAYLQGRLLASASALVDVDGLLESLLALFCFVLFCFFALSFTCVGVGGMVGRERERERDGGGRREAQAWVGGMSGGGDVERREWRGGTKQMTRPTAPPGQKRGDDRRHPRPTTPFLLKHSRAPAHRRIKRTSSSLFIILPAVIMVGKGLCWKRNSDRSTDVVEAFL